MPKRRLDQLARERGGHSRLRTRTPPLRRCEIPSRARRSRRPQQRPPAVHEPTAHQYRSHRRTVERGDSFTPPLNIDELTFSDAVALDELPRRIRTDNLADI